MDTNSAPPVMTQEQETPPAPKPAWKIYTKFGDAGRTKLLGKATTWKDDPRVHVYGTLDEATSAMGMARASTHQDDLVRTIVDLQGELINVMSELATPSDVPAVVPPVSKAQVENLERLIDLYEKERIATGAFVRPGGSLASAALDLARTIVRRAERLVVGLNREEPVNPDLMRYINRLSDLLYVLARIDEQREVEKAVRQALNGAPVQPPVTRLQPVLDLARCSRLIEAGMRRACEIGVPMVLAVVDEAGNLIEQRRMDNALVVSLTLAPNKAITAAAVRLPTHELAQLSQPGGPLFGIDVNMPHLTLVGGGYPLTLGGRVVGAVGVSGGSVEQDMQVAQAMCQALREGE